ncbi:MAG: DUF6515 family protein [Bacteroidota bacterium]
MKKLLILIMLVTGGVAGPGSIEEAKAQTERSVIKRKKRKVRRRTRRRTRRRVKRRVSRRAHYAYSALPRYRATVTVIPRGAVVVRGGGVSYRYHEGIFYRPSGSAFVITRPAVGIRVSVLPPARRRLMVVNQPYFYYYGTFYKPVDNEYEVVEAPEGALVDALPEGYEVEEIDGIEYYALDGVYYQEVETDELESGVGYEVVKV